MKYDKPEIVQLAPAVVSVQGGLQKPHPMTLDGSPDNYFTTTAYEADE